MPEKTFFPEYWCYYKAKQYWGNFEGGNCLIHTTFYIKIRTNKRALPGWKPDPAIPGEDTG